MSHICDCLVEGFSTQQCSPMGRAMMGIDFQNIQHIMEKVAQFKIPITSVKYVDVSHPFLFCFVFLFFFF